MRFWQDLSFAARSLVHNPGFAATAVLSLALGIGANTAMFTVADAVVLHGLPYRDADRLVILWNRSPGLNITQDWFSTAQYFDIKSSHSGFEQLAIAIGSNFNLTGRGEPERITAIRASSNLLPMLGAKPAAGRLFTAREDSPGLAPVAVLTYGAWMHRFGGAKSAVGQAITLNGQSVQIVGVLPSWFSLPREVLPTLGADQDPDILVPLPLAGAAANTRTREDYNIVGKLRPGVTVAQAQAEMDGLTARLRHDFPQVYPPNGGLTFGIVPLMEQVVGDVRRPMNLLIGGVAFVLLIACANVANLLLSRAVAREREIAVRMAMGAGQGRIAAQLLTESALLSMAGGVLGLAFAWFGVAGLRWLGGKSMPRLAEVGVNWEVLLFTLALALASGMVFGMAPVWRARAVDVQENLKGAGRGASSARAVWSRGLNLRRLLAMTELALSVVLLIGAGLLVRSFVKLQSVQPGFNPKGVLTFGLTMSGRRYDGRAPILQAYKQISENLAALPGVTAAGAISSLPLSEAWSWGPITVEGRTPAPGERFLNADVRIVAGDYFPAMRIPLLAGRLLNAADTEIAPRVALVDEFMARQMWPGQDPLGKRFKSGDSDAKSPWMTVSGVVGRVKQYAIETDSRIAYYAPLAQFPAREMTVVLRSQSGPATLAAAARKALAAVDPNLPMYHLGPMTDRVSESMAQRRFSMVLASCFAGLALLLAAVGTYGVMAYLVTQGFRELGIRLAIGASPAMVLKLVLGRGCELAAFGIAAGLAGAFALTRVLRSQVFGVEVTDAATFTAAVAVLTVVALFASFVPALRAARIDPATSLREE